MKTVRRPGIGGAAEQGKRRAVVSATRPRRVEAFVLPRRPRRFRGGRILAGISVSMGIEAVKKRLRGGGRPYFGSASTL